jgi:pimeloyl-ACP methyl ester carboxylesterase
VTAAVRCPVLVLTGEDDLICPLPVVEELASQLPAKTTRLVKLPSARHTIFRDGPDLAFPAVGLRLPDQGKPARQLEPVRCHTHWLSAAPGALMAGRAGLQRQV